MACIRGRSSLQARCLVTPFKAISPRLVRMRGARCRSDEGRGLPLVCPSASESRLRLCTERRLTLPSRGPAPASRVGPLMSNVRRLASEWAASIARQGQCACVHRRKKHCWKAALLSQQVGAFARAVRPSAASARPCCIARAPPSKNRGGSLAASGANQFLGSCRSRQWPFPCRQVLRACHQALNAPRIQRQHSCCTQRKCPDGCGPNQECKCKIQMRRSRFVH
jgi:hypothetical protein